MFRDYDKEYYYKQGHPWSIDGDIAIKEIKDVFLIKGNVLDLGFGVGRHSIEFANLGCVVDSCEVSKIGVSTLSNSSKEKSLPISVYLEDMFNFKFEKYYNVVFAHMTLQYAKDFKEFSSMISKIQKNTLVGGINYIRLPIIGISLEFPFLLSSIEELKELYLGWKFIFERSEKKVFLDGRKGSYILLIAKKLK